VRATYSGESGGIWRAFVRNISPPGGTQGSSELCYGCSQWIRDFNWAEGCSNVEKYRPEAEDRRVSSLLQPEPLLTLLWVGDWRLKQRKWRHFVLKTPKKRILKIAGPKGVARGGPTPPPPPPPQHDPQKKKKKKKQKTQNFYFSNKFSKVANRWGLSVPSAPKDSFTLERSKDHNKATAVTTKLQLSNTLICFTEYTLKPNEIEALLRYAQVWTTINVRFWWLEVAWFGQIVVFQIDRDKIEV